MRPPTGNRVTQGKHGKYNAVDYDDAPDVFVYAPERMTYHAYYPLAGDAGNNLQMVGTSGRHGFCHLEEIYVKSGQTVEKGAKIAKMGYTGLTIPKGLPGRHLHWVINSSGTYIYPPTLTTEPFGGSQGGSTVVLTEADVITLYQRVLKRTGDVKANDPGGVKNYTGKTLDFALNDMINSQEFKNLHVKTIEKVVERIVEKPVEVIKEVPVPGAADPDGNKWRDLKKLNKELLG